MEIKKAYDKRKYENPSQDFKKITSNRSTTDFMPGDSPLLTIKHNSLTNCNNKILLAGCI